MVVTKYLLVYPLEENKNLLINTLSGAVDVVDDYTSQWLQSGEIPDNIKDIRIFKERYYIFNDETEEKQFFKKIESLCHSLTEKHSPNLGFIICPTYSCNLRCIYCFQSHGAMHCDKTVMTREQVDQAFEVMEQNILQYLDKSDYHITLFGGEPLQDHTLDIIEYMLGIACLKKHNVNIITNGVNVDLFWDLFKKFKNILSFQVTLDGPLEIHDKRRIRENGDGSFELITSNLDKLIKDDFKVKVRVNVDCNTIQFLPVLLDYFERNSWVQYKNFGVQLSPVTAHGEDGPTCAYAPEYEILTRFLEVFPDLSVLQNKYNAKLGSDMFRIVGHIDRIITPALKKRTQTSMPYITYCEAADPRVIGVGPDGFMYICGETIGISEYAVGQYWPQYQMFEEKFNAWRNRNIFTIEECSKCDIATLCGGGCPYGALKQNGKPNTPFCGRTKYIIDKYINENKHKIIEMVEG